MKDYRLEVFKKAALCRHFENQAYNAIQSKHIKYPAYLSAGQEFIPCSIATVLEEQKINPDIFIQHRGHSTYLAFGGDIDSLILELIGDENGCANGMGGSASIQCKERNIYGHDGLMGNQIPIAVGACFSKKTPTIAIVGDSAAEEDYVLSSIGWAATKNLPILFIVEDNNLSILTEKKVRRSWEMHNVSSAFGVESYDISDDPLEIKEYLKKPFEKPLLLNINTTRKYWHAGAGSDGDFFDRYDEEKKIIGNEADLIDKETEKKIIEKWQTQLGKL